MIKQAKKRAIKPSSMLLDSSIHHQLMRGLPDYRRRGRPDIVHITLLSALGSPLCRENLAEVYVHTREDYVIEVDPSAHLPRVYNRFTGLVSQLFETKKVPPLSEKPLMKLAKETLGSLIRRLGPTSVTLFTRLGSPATLEETISNLSKDKKPAIIIGGFPYGHLSEENVRLASDKTSIDKSSLESWVVASRAIYEYERAIGLPNKRIGKNQSSQ